MNLNIDLKEVEVQEQTLSRNCRNIRNQYQVTKGTDRKCKFAYESLWNEYNTSCKQAKESSVVVRENPEEVRPSNIVMDEILDFTYWLCFQNVLAAGNNFRKKPLSKVYPWVSATKELSSQNYMRVKVNTCYFEEDEESYEAAKRLYTLSLDCGMLNPSKK